ncbi:MAG: metal-dependent hydrolase [Solirubrobacteraceae bacterium]
MRWISPRALIVATIVFVIADAGDQLVGGSPWGQGPLDESAHVLTALFVVWAIGGRVFDRLLVPVLVASVAIDLDHLPGELGYDFLTRGTPRPYTHSLLTIAILLVASAFWTRRRELLLGAALGVAIHLWRDMAEPGSGVALLWPFSDASWGYSHAIYLAAMALIVAAAMRRSLRTRADRSERAHETATLGAQG